MMTLWDKSRIFYAIGIISMGAFWYRFFLAINIYDILTWIFLFMWLIGLAIGIIYERLFFNAEERFYKGLDKPK